MTIYSSIVSCNKKKRADETGFYPGETTYISLSPATGTMHWAWSQIDLGSNVG